MNEVDGVVIRVERDVAWVRTAGVGSACGACSSRSSCGTAGGDSADRERVLRLPNPIAAKAGDRVVILAADGAVTRAVWLAYVLPLLAGLLGAVLLQALTGNEMIAVLGLLGGLAGGFLALHFRRQACNSAGQVLSIQFKPVVNVMKGPIR